MCNFSQVIGIINYHTQITIVNFELSFNYLLNANLLLFISKSGIYFSIIINNYNLKSIAPSRTTVRYAFFNRF